MSIISKDIEWMFVHVLGTTEGNKILAEVRSEAQALVKEKNAAVEVDLTAKVTAVLGDLVPKAIALLPGLIQPIAKYLVDTELPTLTKLVVEETVVWAESQVIGGTVTPAPVNPT